MKFLWGIPMISLPVAYLIKNNGTDPIIGLITALAGLATAIVLLLRERKKK